MLWIVSGPSSIGKSTFIANPRCSEITGLPAQTPLVFPSDHFRLEEYDTTDVLYHYNTLRPISLKSPHGSTGAGVKHATINSDTGFEQDPSWNDLVSRDMSKKAIVLVTSKQLILRRLRQRQTIEDLQSIDPKKNRYPVRYWLDLVERMDLVALYQAWCRELQARGVPYVLVDSTDDTYPIIEHEDRLPDLVNRVEPDYTKEQIENVLRQHKFVPYHRVNLPFGLHTPGADRSETRDLIFPESLAGETVLDVGSALGYFCFEAEAKGAERVVGVELKEERFRDAMLLKDLKASKVDFLQRDIVLNPLEESFDYVLLLNVIHHLKEPFRFMRQLSSITRKCLIIEFPTFADHKFRKTADIDDPSPYNRLPLVGVSSMSGAEQTFVFTPKAIRRALLDHERLFAKVNMLRSPMPGRRIAMCYKNRNIEEHVEGE